MKYYYVSDFDLAPATIKKRAERLGIEQKRRRPEWASRTLVYFTKNEFRRINHFDYVEFIKNGESLKDLKPVNRNWTGYTCACGAEKSRLKPVSRLFNWGMKTECIKCRKRRRLAERIESRKTTAQKISDYFGR